MPDAGFARAEKQHALVGQFSAGDAQRGQNAGERHGTGALDVVVEGAGAVAVFFQKAEGVAVAEILELDEHAGKKFFHRHHEFLDDRVVGLAANAFLPQAGVKRIGQQGFVVGADINRDRQALRRMNAGAGGVKRQFADGNAHAGRAEIAEAENAFAVGDDDHLHVARRPVLQNVFHLAAIIAGNIKTARPAENVAEFLARLADRGRVNDRHHLLQIVHHHAVKQRLVPVLQADDLDVALDVAGLAAEIVHHAPRLLVHGLDVRRQQPAQAERVALRLGEGGAFVENGIVQPVHAFGRQRAAGFWFFCSCHCYNAQKVVENRFHFFTDG